MRLITWIAGMLPALTATGSLLAPWVGPNVGFGEDPASLPSGDGRNQAEPHVVRSVVEPDLLLATFQEGRFSDGGAVVNGYALSEDGGFTWKRSLVPTLTLQTGGAYQRATDPVAAISREGVLYLNALASMDDKFGLGEVVIQRSFDRGLTWSHPISVYQGRYEGPRYDVFPDKNWMTVNTYAETPTSGRLVVTWTDFRSIIDEVTDIQDLVIMASYSDNNGSTWSLPRFVTPPDSKLWSRVQVQGSQPVFLPDGSLAVVYHRFQGSRLEVVYSPDGGASFPFGAMPVHAGYTLYDAPNMRDGAFLPSVGVAGQTGDLYIVYTSADSVQTQDGHVYFTRSRRTSPTAPPGSQPDWRFSPPMRISGALPRRVVATPTVAVSPDGRRVTVYFYDNRNGTGTNIAGDFYGVQSTDRGTTWTEPFRLTETTFDLRLATQTDRGYMIGDYFGMAPPADTGQAAVAVWVDTRDGTADPWSARIGGLENSVFDAWLQANLPHSLNAGGSTRRRYEDPDRDGAPNVIEYILGRSPRVPEPPPSLGDGTVFQVLDPATDPATTVEVGAGLGRWPVFREEAPVFPQVDAHGEGFWNRLSWPTGGDVEHIRFAFGEGEEWYLLDDTLAFRWVRAFAGGWVWSPWFGWLYTAEAPWLYHLSLGWIYEAGAAVYSARLGSYLYPNVGYHPWLYKADGTLLYLLEGTPWVYDSGSGTWLRGT